MRHGRHTLAHRDGFAHQPLRLSEVALRRSDLAEPRERHRDAGMARRVLCAMLRDPFLEEPLGRRGLAAVEVETAELVERHRGVRVP